MKNKGLTPREKEFCLRFSETLDAESSARLAGYSNDPLRKAGSLLSRDDILREISRLCEILKDMGRSAARRGLEKLAFGSVSDAVSLLYLKNPQPEELMKMDLTCVSEIKAKDGLVEIKFHDRLKALEKLSAYSSEISGDEPIHSVYDAIVQGACALSKKAGDALGD